MAANPASGSSTAIAFAPPGHTPAAEPGTETVEFSPTGKLQETMQVVMKNAEAMAAGR